jgi:O-antigen/teichoic acid export membrane protein
MSEGISTSDSSKKDFKSSLKTTGLFGGVQVYQILIRIVSSKFVAVLLGPVGMGINGLLQSTTQIISSVAGMGLGTSAVRDMSISYASKDENRFFRTLSVFRTLVWYTGIFGALICLFGSPLWSKLSFGNYNYTLAFILIAVTVLFTQLNSGQTVLLQSTRNFKMMAKAGIIGSTIGLFVNIPMYYLWGIKGIVPAIITMSLATLVLSTYFAHKIPQKKIRLTVKETMYEGKSMLNMGFFLMLQGLLELVCGYIVRIYISNTGSIADVGLYNAGFAIINTYVGMVFTAMVTEYYPRLSSYANDSKKFNQAINQQIEISLLLTAPLIAFFLVFGDLAIILLYSNKFLPITWMVIWAMMAIFFRAPSNCTAFSFLAKGDTKAFWLNEMIAVVTQLFINLLFYHYKGLTGLGLSYLLNYFLYNIQVWIITKIRYQFKLDFRIIGVFIPQLLLSSAIILVFYFLGDIPRYVIGTLLAIASAYISYKMLSRYMDVKAFIFEKIHRNE